MRDRSELQRIVRQWRKKADEDLAAAQTLLRARKRTQADNICFHVQQAVEKYIKALLVQHRIGFPKTHSIRELIALLPAPDVPNLEEVIQDRLTDYGVVIRYPGEEEQISLREAEEALRVARRVGPSSVRGSPMKAHEMQNKQIVAIPVFPPFFPRNTAFATLDIDRRRAVTPRSGIRAAGG